jgi:yecA family protein
MALPQPSQDIDPIAGIIHELESAYWRPTRALALAVGHADEIAPLIIDLVEKAARGVILVPRQASLLFWGIHILAAARCTGLFGPLLRLLRNGREADLERLLGDARTETLPCILISVFDGDGAALFEACTVASIDEYVRWGFFEMIAGLTVMDAIPRPTTIEFLTRVEAEDLISAKDEAWQGWTDAITHLRIEELYERVRATWRDGRSPIEIADQEFIEGKFKESLARTADTPFSWQGRKPIDDPVSALSWTAQERHESRVKRDKERAATDPAAGTALERFEIGWLAYFLKSDKVPSTAMSAEQIDGFFHALICGPQPAPSADEYVPVIWNPTDPLDSEEPTYDSNEQAQYVETLLQRHWQAIALRLDRSYEAEMIRERNEDDLDGRHWAGGFVCGVAMRAAQWGERTSDRFVLGFLNACVTLGLSEQEFAKGDIDFDMRDAILETLPVSVVRLHHALRGRPDPFPPPAPTRYEGRKVGRNEPCPCGSGKKFKRCCGSADQSFH